MLCVYGGDELAASPSVHQLHVQSAPVDPRTSVPNMCAVADPEGFQWFARTPSPDPPPPPLKYSMKRKQFGPNETKLFHFHGIFKKKCDKISKANPL